jgi:hypothetical protein
MIRKFDFDVYYSAIFAPKKPNTSITIGNESINLSMIDCIDLDVTNGDLVIRNKIMGNNTIVSSKGEQLKFNRSQLTKFINNYKDRFEVIRSNGKISF